jgi:hypothetical protein
MKMLGIALWWIEHRSCFLVLALCCSTYILCQHFPVCEDCSSFICRVVIGIKCMQIKPACAISRPRETIGCHCVQIFPSDALDFSNVLGHLRGLGKHH